MTTQLDLFNEAKVEITMGGQWPDEKTTTAYPTYPSLMPEQGRVSPVPADLPEALKKPFAVLTAMKTRLAVEKGAEADLAFVETTIDSCEACRVRAAMNPGPGYYRAITAERRQSIIRFYEQTALTFYRGFVKRMERYAASGDKRKRRIALIFDEGQK